VSDALVVSNALLWLAVVALTALVLALLRQVGVLHERIAPAGALVAGEGPAVGDAAPAISAVDWSGQPLTVGGADPERRSSLVFFTSPTCPVCATLLPHLRSVCEAEDRALRLVIASDGARAEHEDFVAEHGLARERYVLSAELGMAYRIGRLPYAVLIDGAGIVRARGLVNTREHLESLFEARNRGVASIQEFAAQQQGPRPASGASAAGHGR
jgi:methylamine dehydrogenase accessory protein MauD